MRELRCRVLSGRIKTIEASIPHVFGVERRDMERIACTMAGRKLNYHINEEVVQEAKIQILEDRR